MQHKSVICYSASSLYMFRVSATPITWSTQNCNYSLRYWSYFCAAISLQSCQSGVHKTVTTATGTGHIFVHLPPSNVANLTALEGGSCTVAEAVVTVLCTPDDGCG